MDSDDAVIPTEAAEKNNIFLNGVVVGMSMKGHTSGRSSTLPVCYNDPGVYSYFYIDFRMELQEMSLLLFLLSCDVVCAAGKIDVYNIEPETSTRYKVYCNLSKAFYDEAKLVQQHWICVYSRNWHWLKYLNGDKLPDFAVQFWLNSESLWDFGIAQDSDTFISPLMQAAENAEIQYIEEGA